MRKKRRLFDFLLFQPQPAAQTTLGPDAKGGVERFVCVQEAAADRGCGFECDSSLSSDAPLLRLLLLLLLLPFRFLFFHQR